MKLISIYLPQELLDDAKLASAEQSISVAALIRIALLRYLKEHNRNA